MYTNSKEEIKNNYDDTTNKELMHVIDNLRTKLASSQGHENLLIKIKVFEEHNNELTSKLGAISSTLRNLKLKNQCVKQLETMPLLLALIYLNWTHPFVIKFVLRISL
jgi:hypothetical protein